MPGKLLKGAFVEFMPTFLVPTPNVIVFQYNPETMTHTWTPSAPEETTATESRPNPMAVKGLPGESFSFTLMMDSQDTVADGNPVSADLAVGTGLYSRLAALEMLLYPSGAFSAAQLVGTVSSALASAAGGGIAPQQTSVPQYMMPLVLFVWGPSRIVPVRLTSLTITEKLFDADLLNPICAEAQVGFQVLTPDEVLALQGPQRAVATVAYDYSQGLRQALAVANLSNATESLLGMLPVG